MTALEPKRVVERLRLFEIHLVSRDAGRACAGNRPEKHLVVAAIGRAVGVFRGEVVVIGTHGLRCKVLAPESGHVVEKQGKRIRGKRIGRIATFVVREKRDITGETELRPYRPCGIGTTMVPVHLPVLDTRGQIFVGCFRNVFRRTFIGSTSGKRRKQREKRYRPKGHFPLCLRISYMATEAAVAAFSDSKPPGIGRTAIKSHFSRTRREMPFPSAPTTRPTRPLKSMSV